MLLIQGQGGEIWGYCGEPKLGTMVQCGMGGDCVSGPSFHEKCLNARGITVAEDDFTCPECAEVYKL